MKIMSRMLDDHVHPWSWSECSRHHATEFLENNHGGCMLNAPDHDMTKDTMSGPTQHKLAGEMFTASEQCRLIYGIESAVCSFMVRRKRGAKLIVNYIFKPLKSC